MHGTIRFLPTTPPPIDLDLSCHALKFHSPCVFFKSGGIVAKALATLRICGCLYQFAKFVFKRKSILAPITIRA